MNHIDEDNLNAYLDGILAPKDVGLIEEHLSSCSICAEKFQEMGSLYSILNGFEEFQIERNLAPDVVATIEADMETFTRLKWGSVIQMLLTSVGLVLVVPYSSSIPWLEIIFEMPKKAIDLTRDGLMHSVFQWSIWLRLIQEKWSDPFSWTFDVQLSQLPIWPLVLIALLMFFVGNGLVLWKLKINGNRA